MSSSLSIARRRSAWNKGVICGATGHGRCDLHVPKLRELYEAGVNYGRTNPESPQVKVLLDAMKRARPQAAPRANRPQRFGNRAPGRTPDQSQSRFGRPGPRRTF